MQKQGLPKPPTGPPNPMLQRGKIKASDDLIPGKPSFLRRPLGAGGPAAKFGHKTKRTASPTKPDALYGEF